MKHNSSGGGNCVRDAVSAVVAVIRGGGGGKSSCRKRRDQQMVSKQFNIPYIRWAGKNKMKTIYLTKARETDRRTDRRTKPLNEMQGRILKMLLGQKR